MRNVIMTKFSMNISEGKQTKCTMFISHLLDYVVSVYNLQFVHDNQDGHLMF